MKNLLNLIIITILLTYFPLFSQEDEHSSEIDSSVPELFEFHEIQKALGRNYQFPMNAHLPEKIMENRLVKLL